MRAERVIWQREVKAALLHGATYIEWAAFTAACGWSFTAALRSGDGGFVRVAELWGQSVGWWLPFLSALLTMRLFSGERASGTLETLLTAPVSEWQVVWGKYWAAFSIGLFGLALTVVLPLLMLPYLAPALTVATSGAGVALAAAALAIQLALWIAVGLFFSLLWVHSVAALVSSLFVCVLLPYVATLTATTWFSVEWLARLGVPGGGWAAEVAGGLIVVSPWVCYGAGAWCFVFMTVQLLEVRQIRSY